MEFYKYTLMRGRMQRFANKMLVASGVALGLVDCGQATAHRLHQCLTIVLGHHLSPRPLDGLLELIEVFRLGSLHLLTNDCPRFSMRVRSGE